MDEIFECVPEIIICFGIILILVFVAATIIDALEPTRYGNNAVLYNKAFNQCVGMLGNIPRNVSTVEDDDTLICCRSAIVQQIHHRVVCIMERSVFNAFIR